jgi:hypothetical protein
MSRSNPPLLRIGSSVGSGFSLGNLNAAHVISHISLDAFVYSSLALYFSLFANMILSHCAWGSGERSNAIVETKVLLVHFWDDDCSDGRLLSMVSSNYNKLEGYPPRMMRMSHSCSPLVTYHLPRNEGKRMIVREMI